MIRRSWPGLAGAAGIGPLVLALAALAACTDPTYFSSDDGGAAEDSLKPDVRRPDSYVNPCAPNPPPSISGRVYAPNGIDPVAGASVHVPLAVYPLPKMAQCASCNVKGKFAAHVYAGADGTFKLTGVPNGTFTLGIQKGHFRRIVKVTVPQCGHLDVPKELTTLPGKNAQWDPLDEIPKIAVSTGVWDKMEKVLDKLGVPERTIYNGRDAGYGPQSLQALLQNPGLMQSYHVILINCGANQSFESLITDPGVQGSLIRQTVRDYVRKGGRLFVTDLSYDYVEQAFPEFIDFEGTGATAAGKPEDHNAAEVGIGNLTVHASVLDTNLKSWLALPEINALLPDQSVEITGFLDGWAVQKSVSTPAGGRVWVSGSVKWIGGSGVRPLMATCDFVDTDKQGCGRVLFSSYHTHGEGAELIPQERILEYMLLEIGACASIEQGS